MQGSRYSCPILKKYDFFPADFREIFKYQISRKSVQWEPSCSMGTDGHTWRS